TVRFFWIITALLWTCAGLGLLAHHAQRTDPVLGRLVPLWIGAATIGFLAVPNFYSHYALPLVAVLSLAAAPYYSRQPLGRVLAVA
ncbi:hypothetical protein ACE4Z7_24995, partial [Salmonella enterica]|uniref:hypothetical protein n=1 Tax=Salmonella enterica TaxID=28901 RepID=UPI003D29352A